MEREPNRMTTIADLAAISICTDGYEHRFKRIDDRVGICEACGLRLEAHGALRIHTQPRASGSGVAIVGLPGAGGGTAVVGAGGSGGSVSGGGGPGRASGGSVQLPEPESPVRADDLMQITIGRPVR